MFGRIFILIILLSIIISGTLLLSIGWGSYDSIQRNFDFHVKLKNTTCSVFSQQVGAMTVYAIASPYNGQNLQSVICYDNAELPTGRCSHFGSETPCVIINGFVIGGGSFPNEKEFYMGYPFLDKHQAQCFISQKECNRQDEIGKQVNLGSKIYIATILPILLIVVVIICCFPGHLFNRKSTDAETQTLV